MVTESSDDPSRNSHATEVASRLRFSTHRLNRLLRQQARTGLTLTKLAHLATVNREGPLTLGDLATIEQVAPPTVTKVVKDLEAMGLLVRIPDPVDGRVVRVDTTAEGRRRINESRTRKDQWLGARLALLTEDEMARLSAALPVLERLADPLADPGTSST